MYVVDKRWLRREDETTLGQIPEEPEVLEIDGATQSFHCTLKFAEQDDPDFIDFEVEIVSLK